MTQKDNALHLQIRSQVRDVTKPFGLLTKLHVVDATAGDRLEAIFRDVIPESRKEPGNLVYHVNRDTADPTLFVLYDRWASLEAVVALEESPHFKRGVAHLKGLIASEPEVFVLNTIGEAQSPFAG